MLQVVPKVKTAAGLKDGLGLSERGERLQSRLSEASSLAHTLGDLGAGHVKRISAEHKLEWHQLAREFRKTWESFPRSQDLGRDLAAYILDAGQRSILFLDIMRQIGNYVAAQSEREARLVLSYDFEMVMDGSRLERPVNYSLVHILPPAGVTVDPDIRPYIIIDPRAGHGAGIGGFKSDSQVGVALKHGHPVYFMIFRQRPEPGQTLSDVCSAESLFVREVARRHPHAPKPVIIGNCQGGWASILLAASNPDVTGPVVVNGAPLSYWAGVKGKNPLRYNGGLGFGALPAVILSDLGNGLFDGAHLVLNFEAMNPGNTWWRKYYNVFANADTEGPRFIGFEKWWSSFYLMNEAEIRWIVENLFIGNKLQRGDALLGGRGPVDIKKIKAPIIVFASQGDDITPPPQALNWIPAVYGDEREIRARGQRIIYMVHEDIGHLGIFVSAKVAKKEHDRIVSTLQMIESLPPGLYEMRIQQKTGEGVDTEFVIDCEERTIKDLAVFDDGHSDEKSFALVDRLSRFWVDSYDLTLRPLVKSMVTPVMAEAMIRNHPLRLRRTLLSDRNPLMPALGILAGSVREARQPASPNNIFLRTEGLFATALEQTLNFWSHVSGARKELLFYMIYANPFLARLTEGRHPDPEALFGENLRELPKVEAALIHIEHGGFAEAVVRMLILLARSRGAVRQSRLEKADKILHTREPFKSMEAENRATIINDQTLIIDFEPEKAIETLGKLLPDEAAKWEAMKLIDEIMGDMSEMAEPTVRMYSRLRDVLGLPQAALPVRQAFV